MSIKHIGDYIILKCLRQVHPQIVLYLAEDKRSSIQIEILHLVA